MKIVIPWWLWVIFSISYVLLIAAVIVFLLLWIRKRKNCSQECVFNIQDTFETIGNNCFKPINTNQIPIKEACVSIEANSGDPIVIFTVQPLAITITSSPYSQLPSNENSPLIISVGSKASTVQLGWFRRTDVNGSKIIGLRNMTDPTDPQRFCINTTNMTISITGPLDTPVLTLDS